MTIDINELRRLAQAATPGTWKTGQYLGSLRQFVIHTDVGDKGRGSDVAFTSAAFGNDETVANARLIAAANPAAITELLDRIETAEKERDALRAEVESWKGLAAQFGRDADEAKTHLAFAKDELNHLRSKIEAMERQEPVAWLHETRRDSDVVTNAVKHVWGKAVVGALAAYSIPLYLAPGAQPAPIIPEGWKPIPEKHPTFDLVDLRLADGSVLCGCLPQRDGDYWWKGPNGEVFIDPKYASVTHWRPASEPTPEDE